jgi:hypothetical protein
VKATESVLKDGGFASSGFSQALFEAGFSGPATGYPAAAHEAPLNSPGSFRSVKPAKQQPPKEEKKSSATVPVLSSPQSLLSQPLRIQGFAWGVEEPEQGESEGAKSNGEASSGQAEASQAPIGDPAHHAPVPVAPENPASENPAAPSGDLAFAARVQTAPTQNVEAAAQPRPLKNETASTEQSLPKKAGEKDAEEPTLVQPVAAGADASLMSQGQHAYANAELPAPPTAAPAASPTPAAAPAPPVEPKVFEPQAKPAGGLKDISLQVSQPGNQKVEVRMVQRLGELHVAVRTGDSELAHGLQQGLPDLVGRLQDNGFRAETWRPGGAAVQAGPVFEARTSPGGSQNNDSHAYSGGSQQQAGERRQNQSQRPAWVEELESTVAGAQQSQAQGVTYGIGS